MFNSYACITDRTRQWLAEASSQSAIVCALLLLVGSIHSKAQAAPPLRTVEAVRRLAADDAAKKLPVRLKAVVVFFDADWRLLFVQDQALAIYVESASGLMEATGGKLEPGCVVEFEGYSGAGMFAPVVFSQKV